jgi:hypothetical protein
VNDVGIVNEDILQNKAITDFRGKLQDVMKKRMAESKVHFKRRKKKNNA